MNRLQNPGTMPGLQGLVGGLRGNRQRSLASAFHSVRNAEIGTTLVAPREESIERFVDQDHCRRSFSVFCCKSAATKEADACCIEVVERHGVERDCQRFVQLQSDVRR